MRFSELINKYSGAKIAILGSGPTLNEFKGLINSICDVVIASNGSLLSLNPKEHKIDYFIYYDIRSHLRQWFGTSINFKGCKRILPFYMLKEDKFSLSRSLRSELGGKQQNFVKGGGNFMDFWDEDFVNKTSSYLFRVKDFNENLLLKDINSLLGKATITGIASQLAFFMGVKELYLFGCSFDNVLGNEKYSYDNKGEPGQVSNIQRENMELILNKISQKGVKIFSLGKTSLNLTEIIS